VVTFTNPWTSTRYSFGRILDYPHSYHRIYDVIHAKHKNDLIEVMNYMLKDLQSKYDRFSSRQAISCDQAIRIITIDLHSLKTSKMSGALPLLLLYNFMTWTVTLPYLYYHQSPFSHLIFLRSTYVYALILHLPLFFKYRSIKIYFIFSLTHTLKNYTGLHVQSHFYSFDLPKNVILMVQIMKLLVT
jgi:hypothetical protein